jgi:hypothetical protein
VAGGWWLVKELTEFVTKKGVFCVRGDAFFTKRGELLAKHLAGKSSCDLIKGSVSRKLAELESKLLI